MSRKRVEFEGIVLGYERDEIEGRWKDKKASMYAELVHASGGDRVWLGVCGKSIDLSLAVSDLRKVVEMAEGKSEGVGEKEEEEEERREIGEKFLRYLRERANEDPPPGRSAEVRWTPTKKVLLSEILGVLRRIEAKLPERG